MTTTKEEYDNILNELPKFLSLPAIAEPGVILADGEQRKQEIE